MIKQIESENLDECLKKSLRGVIHYTTLKDGTKPCCETCPATKEYAEKNDARCYIPRKFYNKIMPQAQEK